MPLAVTHILFAGYLASLANNLFSLHLTQFDIFIAALAGVLPDIDFILFWVGKIFKNTPLLKELSHSHRTFTHSVFFIAPFLLLSLIFFNIQHLCIFFAMISFGITAHILLDMLVGPLLLFYPLSHKKYGLEILPQGIKGALILESVDGVLFIFWLIYQYIFKGFRGFF